MIHFHEKNAEVELCESTGTLPVHGDDCDRKYFAVGEPDNVAATQNSELLEGVVWIDFAWGYYQLVFASDDNHSQSERTTCICGNADVHRIDLRFSW